MKNRWVVSWVFIWSQLHLVLCEDAPVTENNFTTPPNAENPSKGIFSPRMDYDQWKPLGRGDPLKNDPTYDYVPPVLDRVHYWMDPALRKPDPGVAGDSQKTEILLLGVSSKKPSTGTSSAVADSRKDNYDTFLKFVDGPKFNNHQRISRPHYPLTSYFSPNVYTKNKNKGNEQRMPYTMLMPPPMATKSPNSQKPVTLQQQLTTNNSIRTTQETESTTNPSSATSPVTTPEVTVQTANLVYHSSSLSNVNEWKSTESSTNLTPNPSPTHTTKKSKPAVFQKHLQPPESYIQIQFSTRDNLTNKPLVGANSDHNINYVTPPPLAEEVMHKGEVSDDKLDISNTYVKIGKPEAQMSGMDSIPSMLIFSHVKHPSPLTHMQPPPKTTTPTFKRKPTTTILPIIQALEKEKTTQKESTTTASTISTTPATTTTTSLTTDPLFKHYKQPAEPLKGPLYLIIQGHSKVKTYGPSKQFHGIRVHETNNEIPDDKDEIHVKHLHSYLRQPQVVSRSNGEDRRREARSGNLQTLKHVIQTRLGAIDFGSEVSNLNRRQDVQETELHFGYEVRDDVTTEKYHKGIVEEARQLQLDAN